MNNTQKMKLTFILWRLLPIKKKTVMFKSFDGQYSDNPKYISEELHKQRPDYQQVWSIGELCNEKVPNYIKKVAPDSLAYYWYAAKSQVVIDNMTGIRGVFQKKRNVVLEKMLKSKRQLNISTWHGTPFKKIGFDIPGKHEKREYFSSADYITGGSEFYQECFKTAYPGLKIKLYGSPRNDCLFRNSDKSKLKNKLGLPVDKKVVLFAPTFRESEYESGMRQIEELDIECLLKTLSDKFGGEWIFVYRLHHEVQKKLDTSPILLSGMKNMFNGNKGDDMAEYLCITDVLITDYSSSFFDFAITKKPCFIFALDKNHYENVERGFYISMEELPYSIAESTDELYENIVSFKNDSYIKKTEEFMNRIGNTEMGDSSEKVVKDIVNFCE